MKGDILSATIKNSGKMPECQILVPSPGIEPRYDDFQSSAVTNLANSAHIRKHIFHIKKSAFCPP